MSATIDTTAIPHIHLLCISELYSTAFNTAARDIQLPSHISSLVTIHNGLFDDLPSSLKFDLIVSPANSYGILDGGFDDAISQALSPASDYHALTRAAQEILYDKYRGFAPPSTCTLVEIPAHFGNLTEKKLNGDGGWGCRHLALCPTMRVPGSARWDREVVYECIWSLLCKVDGYNRAVATSTSTQQQQREGHVINSILMTPMATGTGGVSADKWAAQLVWALKHFDEAVRDAKKWSNLRWRDIRGLVPQVQKTHEL